MRIIALIVAAGSGVRAGGTVPKQYRKLAGVPLLRHTLQCFLQHPSVTGARAVIQADHLDLYTEAVKGLNLGPPVNGGATRHQSVQLGLESLAADPPDLVLIHDGARPFVDTGTIDAVLAALETAPGAIAALPVIDTVKRAAGHDIVQTVPRDGLWRALTPQGFHFQAILDAYRKAQGTEMTDDAAVAEFAGLTVKLVHSNDDNFKVTTADDLVRANHILANRPMLIRMGQGYDVHRFEPGGAVMLCGIEIPHDRKLAGHSDADVALHALTDAILGAIGQGDIGQHFPPSDARWKGAESWVFLRHAGELVRAAGGEIVNLDVTIICETPRIGPHRILMQKRIEQILDLPAGRVNVKATTTEGLGFAGRGEGIAALAVAGIKAPQ